MRAVRVAVVLVTAVVAAAGVSAWGDQSYGAGVKLTKATSIKALYEKPESFVGKTVRIDGVVTAVCEEMGCWLAIGDPNHQDQAVRFKVVDEGKIVFPMTAKGRRASAEGEFVKLTAADKDGQEAAGEHKKQQPTASEFGQKYQVKITGAIVK